MFYLILWITWIARCFVYNMRLSAQTKSKKKLLHIMQQQNNKQACSIDHMGSRLWLGCNLSFIFSQWKSASLVVVSEVWTLIKCMRVHDAFHLATTPLACNLGFSKRIDLWANFLSGCLFNFGLGVHSHLEWD